MIDTSQATSTYTVREVLTLLKSTVKQKPEFSSELAAAIADTQMEVNSELHSHIRDLQVHTRELHSLLFMATSALATGNCEDFVYTMNRSKAALSVSKYDFISQLSAIMKKYDIREGDDDDDEAVSG